MNEDYKEVKTRLDGMALFYGEYRGGQSIGRALHYLASIFPFRYDNVVFHSGGLVKLFNKDFARIDWSKGYPHFTFLDKEHEHLHRTQERLLSFGEWYNDRSSGYMGWRCQKCATWIYLEDKFECNCDVKKIDGGE